MAVEETKKCEIQVSVVQTGREFLERATDFLYENEPANNTVLSVSRLIDNDEGIIGPPYWFGIAIENDTVVGCALHASPDGLCIPDMNAEAAYRLTLAFSESGITANRICGIEEPARIAGRTLGASTEYEYHVSNIWQGVTAVKARRPSRIARGDLRLARKEEAQAIEELGRQYGEEKPAVVDVASYFLRKLEEEMLWVWDDKGIRTVIAMGGASLAGIRVSGVFAPMGDRGKGYASTALWTLTRHYLDSSYKFATLVVEKEEPDLLRMYKSLGYEPCKMHIELLPIDN